MARTGFARTVIILALLMLSAAGVAAQDATPAPDRARWLLTIGFDAAVIESKGAAGATLSLTGVHPFVVAFTDAPQRLATVMPLDAAIQFIDTSWDVPPNADVVTQSTDSGTSYQLVVELVSIEQDTAFMTLDVVGISAFVDGAERTFTELLPLQLGPGYLFIDDFETEGGPVGSPGVLSGNVVQVPVHFPVSVIEDNSTPEP